MRMHWIHIVATISALATACGDARLSAAGETHDGLNGFQIGNLPEIGLIAERNVSGNLGEICTGTAVSPNVVLTAGHCVDKAYFFFTGKEDGTITEYPVRDRWRSPSQDIGLLRMWDRIPDTRPIKKDGKVDAVAAIVGFGFTDCHYALVPGDVTYERGTIRKRIGFFTTMANGWIVPGFICRGDSGGPVIDWSVDGGIFGVVAVTTGSLPSDIGVFTANNAGTNWQDLNFVIWIWQSQSNAGQ